MGFIVGVFVGVFIGTALGILVAYLLIEIGKYVTARKEIVCN